MKSDLYSSIKPIDNYVLQHCQELIKGLVLDVGCGRGKYIKKLEKSLGIESIFGLDCNIEVLRGNKDRICVGCPISTF